jgi:hypothetical protein
MDIYIVQSDGQREKYFGNTKNGIPVPRIGERIFLGYTPAPIVKKVVYYLNDKVYVSIDGLFLD